MVELVIGFIIGVVWYHYSERNSHYVKEDWNKIKDDMIREINEGKWDEEKD